MSAVKRQSTLNMIKIMEANAKKVFVKANFLKISNINTVKEEFLADVLIQARWREPVLDHYKDNSDIDLSKYWNPKIVITNSATSASNKTWRSLKLSKTGEAFITEKQRIKGVFSESLELHEFPFDVQDLSLVVSSALSDDLVEIIEDDEEISAVNVVCFVDETEWHICDLVYSEPRAFNRELTETQFRNPALLVKCIAKRRAGFFLYNIILIMTMISTLSLTTFAVDKSKTENRLQLSFIILLTGVTFKMVANQSIPKIPYLTHLDRAILGCMANNWIVAVWHAVISRFNGETYSTDMDTYAWYIIVALFVVLQLIFYIFVMIQRLRRNATIDERCVIYQEKAERLMGVSWQKERTRKKDAFSRRNKIDAGGNFAPKLP